MTAAIRSVLLGGLLSVVAVLPAGAQSIAPQSPAAPTTPAAASEPPKTVKTEVERKGRAGLEVFIGTYLTLSKECKVGVNPKLEIPEQPKHGKLHTRPNAINLRAVPGAPRTNCIGTSPYGLGVFYRSERRFKGEDVFTFRLVYPTGDIREVTTKVVVQ